MRMMSAVALGSVVVLTGCATKRVSSNVSLPPPRVISYRAPSAPPPRVVSYRTAPAPVVTPRVVRTYTPPAATAVHVPPPSPPSWDLVRGGRSSTAPSPNRVVPVSRSGRVQPAVAAPMVRAPARRVTSIAPAVAPPSATRSRPCTPVRYQPSASPCDVQRLFAPTTPCRPLPVNNCPGGT